MQDTRSPELDLFDYCFRLIFNGRHVTVRRSKTTCSRHILYTIWTNAWLGLSLLFCWGDKEAKVASIVAFKLSALVILLLQSPWVTVIPWLCRFGIFGRVGWDQVLLENQISIKLFHREVLTLLKCSGKQLLLLYTG